MLPDTQLISGHGRSAAISLGILRGSGFSAYRVQFGLHAVARAFSSLNAFGVHCACFSCSLRQRRFSTS